MEEEIDTLQKQHCEQEGVRKKWEIHSHMMNKKIVYYE
jgi:hypothetical protein